MSLGKRIVGALFTTEEDADKVDPAKPLGDQIKENKHFTVLGDSHAATPASASATVSLPTEADRAKYDQYFNNLYEAANCPRPSYHEFIAIAEAFQELPANVRFPKALNSFKGKLSKDIILSTAKDTLKAVQLDADGYNKTAQDKLETEVGAKKRDLQMKQSQVAELQKQIIELEGAIVKSEREIQQKTAGYNSYSSNLQSKIQKDIEDIQSNL